MQKRHRTNTPGIPPLGLLLLAAVLRLGIGIFPPTVDPAPEITPSAPAAAPAVEAVQTVRIVAPDLQIPAAPEPIDPPAVPASADEPPAPVTLAFPGASLDANALEIRNQTGYTVSLEELADTALTFDAAAEGPTVLLIHTHTTEAYTPEPGWEYEASDLMRTMDSRYNMIRVGDEVERILTEAGLWVIHDEQINDYPSYNGSYGAALGRIEMWLERYPTIQVVLDLHRDAAEDAQGRFVKTACTVDGADAAQLMLVCGTDYGGLQHPNWRGNLSFAAQLQLTLEQHHPGICRPLDLRCERFNQHATAMSLLVEVGSVGDTLARALLAADALGEAVASLLCTP